MMERLAKFQLVLTFLIRNVQNFDMNLPSWSLTMTSSMSWCLTHILKNMFVVNIVVVVVLIGPNLANVENLFIIAKMAYFFCHFRSHVMKFIATLLYGHAIVGKCPYNPNFFLCTNFVVTLAFGS